MKRVVCLLRVIVCPAPNAMPHVDRSVRKASLSPVTIRDGLSFVQSFVFFPKFVSNDLLSVNCVEELEKNLLVGRRFLTDDEFHQFGSVSCHASAEIYANLF